MGGNVAITVKEPSGKLWKMDRWTNIVPYFLSQVSLYNGNFNVWLKEFTDNWLAMQSDYERNKATGKFEEPMTAAYFPFNTTSPSEYGLIVIDAQKKKIYSAQDYCLIGEIGLYKLREPEDQDNLQALMDAGFIKQMNYVQKVSQRKYEPRNITIEDTQGFIQSIRDIFASRYSFFDEGDSKAMEFKQTLAEPLKSLPELDLFSSSLPIESDWTFFVVPVSGSRAKANVRLLAELILDGWEFTAEDYTEWQEYLVYYLEDYEPDEEEYEDEIEGVLN